MSAAKLQKSFTGPTDSRGRKTIKIFIHLDKRTLKEWREFLERLAKEC